jgi:hypothetical protein
MCARLVRGHVPKGAAGHLRTVPQGKPESLFIVPSPEVSPHSTKSFHGTSANGRCIDGEAGPIALQHLRSMA